MSDYNSGHELSDFKKGDRVVVHLRGGASYPATVQEVTPSWVRVLRDDGVRAQYWPSRVEFAPQPEGKTLLEKLHAAYVEHDGVRAEMASLREELAETRVEVEALRKALAPLLERS